MSFQWADTGDYSGKTQETRTEERAFPGRPLAYQGFGGSQLGVTGRRLWWSRKEAREELWHPLQSPHLRVTEWEGLRDLRNDIDLWLKRRDVSLISTILCGGFIHSDLLAAPGFCHPSFLTRKKTALLSSGSGWCEGSWEPTPHWSSLRGAHHPRTHDGGPGNSMTLWIFGLQVKGCRKRKRLPKTEGDHIRGLHLNPELGNHPTLSLLQSKFITACRHILLFIHRETGE